MGESSLTASESDAALTSAFVVHLHHAFGAGVHYDLRLEVDGALVSFAIPKEPTLDPLLKHPAIQTEDHIGRRCSVTGILKSVHVTLSTYTCSWFAKRLCTSYPPRTF
jgi:DNA polymerase Ligase (LigD)